MQKQAETEEKVNPGPLLPGGGLGKSRIEALADGIFAVAMTLLVFNVHLPDALTGMSTSDVGSILYTLFLDKGQGAVLLAYAMSFAQLGVYWVSHQAQFQYIKRTDRYLLWINILFLLLISFVPFTTQALGAHWYDPGTLSRTVLIIYGSHLILIGGVVSLHWWYATHHRRLTDPDLNVRLIQVAARRTLAGPVICIIAFVFAFVNPVASMVCYLLIPVYYILPGRVDWHWRVQRHNHEAHEHHDAEVAEEPHEEQVG
ncbi:MAG TPA: TMEM175 family protein [Ktedonosporobacter sp.]|nr:TMEM175 family protein [Ktedonosporobacter sp.]